jgi:glycosyltransferase involved in cell wall biosynthesis
MKIIHLCDSLNPAGLGGYESYLHYLSEELSVRGNESIIVTQAPKRDSPSSIKFDHYRILHLQGNSLEARKWEFYDIPEELREKEVDRLFQRDDLERNVDALSDQLGDVLEDIRPDLIHAHSTYVVFNRVLKKFRENGFIDDIPTIVTIHGRPKSLVLPSGEHTTDYDSFSKACPFDCILSVSRNVADELRKSLSKHKQEVEVDTLYLGANLSVFHPVIDATKDWDIAFMGRFEKMKAVDLFPEMLVRLKPQFPKLKFLMTGDGSLKTDLLRDFEQRGVSDLVDYQGVVDTKMVPELLNRSRVFLYPSREEPFGLSILEAMACEIPVVTTNVYGPSEILTQGVDGLMVPPDDVETLAESVKSLLENTDLRISLGRNARKKIESQFDIKQHYENLVNLYKKAIESKKKESGT